MNKLHLALSILTVVAVTLTAPLAHAEHCSDGKCDKKEKCDKDKCCDKKECCDKKGKSD